MGILKTRKNKKFNYAPRYYNSEKEGSPFEMEHRFDKYRTTVGNTNGLKGKFKNAIGDLRAGSDRRANGRIFLIVLVLVLVFLYIIDFDLTIFT
ncbi:MAG: riboflavin synthase subunit beta [Flavobacteriaceae bacterium]|nr:riboflavin synthase subunit beta [Flavobacteriaceae bacterium]